jgi:hypothetical protein
VAFVEDGVNFGEGDNAKINLTPSYMYYSDQILLNIRALICKMILSVS